MNSSIDRKIDNEYIAFKHVGELKNFEEMPFDATTQEWTGAMDTYRLTQKNGITVLDVTKDCIEKYANYLKKIFPDAMELIKELSENEV